MDDRPLDFAEGSDFITFTDDGMLDDIALTGVEMFRMERMSDGHFWIRIYRTGGRDVVFDLAANGGKLLGAYELDYDLPEPDKDT